MSETSLSPKRPRLDFDENSGKHELFEKYNKNRDRERDQDDQSNYSHSHSKHRKRQEPAAEDEDGKEDEGKAKLGGAETARREHTLVIRLTNKEQELQDCMNQIQEMKQAQTQNTAQLRSMLLDPAINLVFQRMAKEMDDHKDKLKQKQNELTAWKFTPDSQTGMRVMARCRMLLSENQELGKMISAGRTAKLEGEIVLHKALVTEMKKNQKELDEFVGELEEDVEGMQGMIFMLRQQLKEAQEQIARLQAENEQLRTLRIPPDPEPGGSSQADSGPSTPLHSWDDATNSASTTGACSAAGEGSKQAAVRTTPLVASPSVPGCPVSESPPLSTINAPTAPHHPDHLLSVAATTQPLGEEDFNTGVFASKVTPDSGVHTQEEEDEETSMDTTEPPSSTAVGPGAVPQQPPQTCDQINAVKPLADSTVTSKDCNSCAAGSATTTTTAGAERESSTVLTSSSSSSSPSRPVQQVSSNVALSPGSKVEQAELVDDHTRTTTSSSSHPVLVANSSGDTNNSNHHLVPSPTEQTSSPGLAGNDTGPGRPPVEGSHGQIDSSSAEAKTDHSEARTTPLSLSSSQAENQVAIGGERTTTISPPSAATCDDEHRIIQEENKSQLHASLTLDINPNPKVEEDKLECQAALGLVNGTKTHN